MLPEDLKYTKEHEWIKFEGDFILIGITDYAQGELGDIVFVELPSVGENFSENDTIGTIEAVKTVADIYCPVDGEVVELNTEIENSPELINSSPYNDGWLIKLKVSSGSKKDHLLTHKQYQEIIL
ncbi:MAG: glycine cleavage system protein H [Candidatus Marinimicrobia bacterium]|jgi:glycine cleavage system H protein|nr:glycine cleavage system protein H [Candidatus Neomarinimicrobiota bacterium]|tara:strand:- start:18894 stop:19268 length:375 start_codon:yes stop_codon:yes gene_type:complete